jgi:hypothetical protein
MLFGKRVEQLETALAGGLRAGDQLTDELVRLSKLTARQKRTLWRVFNLLKRGRYDDAVLVLETECCEPRSVKDTQDV